MPVCAEPVCTVVLVHSPLVGALTWADTATDLRGTGLTAVVVDLGGAADHAGIVAAVAAALESTALESAALESTALGSTAAPGNTERPPIVLVGHSAAGRHLPGLAAATPGVALLVYVDAALATPGRSWFDDAPPDLAAHLRGLVDGAGLLPPWHEWFAAGALEDLLPDADLRRRFVAGLPRLPLSGFSEPAPPATWSGPQVYVRLSDAYRDEATRMAADGVPVIERAGHHLSMLTDPAMVADAIRTALAT